MLTTFSDQSSFLSETWFLFNSLFQGLGHMEVFFTHHFSRENNLKGRVDSNVINKTGNELNVQNRRRVFLGVIFVGGGHSIAPKTTSANAASASP